ncbi:hypothetical protein CONCODRAFT_138085 [Conidiobolus coronatus NRRL 28638]|uniref:RNI-like protein n=1 Tax=Conidiobolus coronatus (strain ATCC 28846 / CBS 209.66 / NRRL 28638) TaxID=796925 RepID=A0A137NST3_CONC2|nr:hypothetical protein CONCODRAFT_138085 [Conidiobolus coronatus NRRL 28638]|eukprot:KXN65776.1 hypothetical protein CONCODRAFT_138085 [Conidiobolus coronatus NRRL 28638]
MSSKKLKWSFILSLPELNQYLSKPDLTNNSQISSYNRTKLKSFLFKSVNINDLIDLIPEDMAYEADFEKNHKELNSKFSHIQEFVKRIEFTLSTNPFLIPVIVDYFFNISNLTIREAILPHHIFKLVVNNLKNIKILKINYCLILFDTLANEVEDIQLPEGLSALQLTQTGGVSTVQFENIADFYNDDSDEESETRIVNLRFSTKFSNLKKLRFLRGSDQTATTLESFILENRELEVLDVYTDQLSTHVYNLLATHCSNLKSLKILPSSEGLHQLLEFDQYPTIPSVENLNLQKLGDYGGTILYYLISPFPNVKNLTLSRIHPFKPRIYKIVQNFKKLKKLIIYAAHRHDNLDNFDIKSDTLDTLELNEFNNIRFNMFC